MSFKPTKKSASYLLRLTPEKKARWHHMAAGYRLPLSEFIEKRVEGRPLSLPKVPAINAQVSVKLGQLDIQLRRLSQHFYLALSALVNGEKENKVISQADVKELIESVKETQSLLEDVRLELREIRLQLSGVDNAEEEVTIDPSTFEAEDWE